MGKIYAGTSGWAYATWKPGFYPAKLPPAKFLGYYGTRLNSVELNYTFRRRVTEKLLEGWIAATPPDFKFAVKAHQTITHITRLRGSRESTLNFIGSLDPLRQAGKLGPILFQLPPFLKCDASLLEDFLAVLPRNTLAAMEFRHVFLVLRRFVRTLAWRQCGIVPSRKRQTGDARRRYRRLPLLPPAKGNLFVRHAQGAGRPDKQSRPFERRVRLF
jgi:uncharacterized protein YecE (DUF72 family)